MLVNPPPYLSHALSSMHRECIYMKQMEREGRSPHGDGSGGDMIGPSVATQSR